MFYIKVNIKGRTEFVLLLTKSKTRQLDLKVRIRFSCDPDHLPQFDKMHKGSSYYAISLKSLNKVE